MYLHIPYTYFICDRMGNCVVLSFIYFRNRSSFCCFFVCVCCCCCCLVGCFFFFFGGGGEALVDHWLIDHYCNKYEHAKFLSLLLSIIHNRNTWSVSESVTGTKLADSVFTINTFGPYNSGVWSASGTCKFSFPGQSINTPYSAYVFTRFGVAIGYYLVSVLCLCVYEGTRN